MIINANALHIPLADQSVHMIVTSPPYWGLRDYGTATWIGGDAECDHKKGQPSWRSRETSTIAYSESQGHNLESWGDICGKCGAIRIDNQLGLERTPEEYIANMVAVFRECWRVLRDDGTLWINVGDSYASNMKGNNNNGEGGSTLTSGARPHVRAAYNDGRGRNPHKVETGLKPKDLVGIPWRLAFALQADGWYLRSDIIWSKPNPMPESVTDRPTKSHEYLFLLAKQERYYYDAEAIREENSPTSGKWGVNTASKTAQAQGNGKHGKNSAIGQDTPHDEAVERWYTNGRNARTVWTIPTAPYKGAHFATFPPALVEPCIKAGTSERGCCPKCGKGWRRVVEKSGGTGKSWHNHENDFIDGQSKARLQDGYKVDTIDWQPSCTCNAGEPIPCLVFDPFVGSGTTVKVAYDLGRRGVGLDLSLDYLDEQARKRIHNGHTARLF